MDVVPDISPVIGPVGVPGLFVNCGWGTGGFKAIPAMQIFTCPFCGDRDEREFLFAIEAGKRRPEPAAAVSDADWADYLHAVAAPKGPAREVWLHLTCGDYFLMTRDTVTRQVLAVDALPGRQA